MKQWGGAIIVALVLSGCTSSYPYLVTTNNCNCERYTYVGDKGRLLIGVSAQYEISDRITSKIELVFRNAGRDTLSLRQAFLKGTSTNMQYQSNGKFQPLPYVQVPPGAQYTVTLEGGDLGAGDDPWLKIAGERVVLEIRGLLAGYRTIAPIVLSFIPFNPKLAS